MLYGQNYTNTKEPLQPIVEATGTVTHRLAKHLAGLLAPLVGPTEHHIKNSNNFIQQLKCTTMKETNILISSDVVSLFTKVPIKKTLQLLEQQSECEVLYVFKHMITSTYLFNQQYYDQKDGVAMRSPLMPIVSITMWNTLRNKHWIQPP
jgi:hypothetical protein